MVWSLVCPASRGIGFELTRQLLTTTKIPIVATARIDLDKVKNNILSDLKDVDPSRLTVLQVDVTDESTISNLATELQSLFPPSKTHLHLAFSLPGILYPEKSPSQLTHDQLSHSFAVNTIGPTLLSKHLLPFLPKKSTVLPSPSSQEEKHAGLPKTATYLNLAARVGSTTNNYLGGWYSYRASKSALISYTKSFDLHLKTRAGDNAMALAYHPGTVKTDLSKEFWGNVKGGSLFDVGFAVERLRGVVGVGLDVRERGDEEGKGEKGRWKGLEVGLEGRGRCWDWKGEEIVP